FSPVTTWTVRYGIRRSNNCGGSEKAKSKIATKQTVNKSKLQVNTPHKHKSTMRRFKSGPYHCTFFHLYIHHLQTVNFLKTNKMVYLVIHPRSEEHTSELQSRFDLV